MAINRVISNVYNSGASTLNTHTTSSINFTGSDCIIIAVMTIGSATGITLSDSDGNTYTLIGTTTQGNQNTLLLYRMIAGTFGSKTITLNIGSIGARAAIISIGYSGVDQTTPVYDSYVKAGASGGATQVVTTTKTNDFILSFLGGSGFSPAPTAGSGQNIIHFSDGPVVDLVFTEEPKATAGADTQSFTHNFSFNTCQGHFALSEAVGGGPGPERRRIFLTT